jgi:hypothetical protein
VIAQELLDILTNTVEVGSEALASTPSGAPATVGVYHTIPPDDCGDFLIAWIDRIYGYKNFPAEEMGPTLGFQVMPAVKIKYRLVRNCWPSLHDDAHNPFPPRDETDPVALNLAFDGITLWCAYFSDLQSINLRRSRIVADSEACSLARVEALVPDKVRAGYVGWTGSFTLALDSCVSCVAPPVA